jgi:hypothetical protein
VGVKKYNIKPNPLTSFPGRGEVWREVLYLIVPSYLVRGFSKSIQGMIS